MAHGIGSDTHGVLLGRRLALAVLLLGLLAACTPVAATDRSVRLPAVAGAFYPADAKELSAMVDGFLAQAPAVATPGRVVGLLVPHAGYVFSGAVAACAWKALAGAEIDTVYVLGTSHYGLPGSAYAWSGSAFRTPLGDYPVDEAAVQDLLRACPALVVKPEFWAQEHSVEVEVPFLQKVAPHAKLVPIVMGDCPPAVRQALAAAIAQQAAGRKAVIVASSDLSHYPAWADAERVDADLLQAVVAMDPERMERADRKWLGSRVPELVCTLCGLSAAETMIEASKRLGARQAKLLKYANAGDVSGDKTRVVGYGAVVLFGPAASGPAAAPEASGELAPDQQAAVLKLARSAIAEAIAHPAAPSQAGADLPGWWREDRAVFVTLKEKGELRGCIGMTEARLPLHEAVRQMACAAAFEDPRFYPIKAEELPKLDLEISLLTPLKRVHSADEIRMGVHGVVVKREGRSGLFLPQVATETGWSKTKFLDELCTEKAGLPAGAWRDPRTELYVFTVQSFQQAAAEAK